MVELYKKEIIKELGGLTVITLNLPNRRSIASGVWVMSGSRSDPKNLPGMAHLIEHMVFKKTAKYTNRQINQLIEGVGGTIEAFTNYDVTAFYSRILSDHTDLALEIISEMTTAPQFNDFDLEKEKRVIIEEINSDLDDPAGRAYMSLMDNLWTDYSMKHPILGNRETITNVSTDDIKDAFSKQYVASNMLLVACGDTNHDEFVKHVKGKFGNISKAPYTKTPSSTEMSNLGKIILVPDKMEQAFIFIVTPFDKMSSLARYPVSVLGLILGGTPSSRLFHSLREEAGNAYAVSSGMDFIRDNALMVSHAAVHGSTVEESLKIMLNEMDKLRNDDILPSELERTRNMIAGRLALSSESTGAMLSRMMSGEIIFNEFTQLDESLKRYMNVQLEQVNQLAREMFVPEKSTIFIYGNIPEKLEIDGYETIIHEN